MTTAQDRDRIRQALAGHDLFLALPSEALDLLVEHGQTLALASGQVLFRKGDGGDCLYYLLRGRIQIGVEVAPGDVQVMNMLNPGAVFGEIALLDDLPRTADAVAVETTRVFVVTRSDFKRFFLDAHPLQGPIIRLLCERMRWASTMVEAQSRAEAAERQRLADKERMEHSLRQWMSDTSHELRTPIAVLRAQIEALQDGIVPVDAQRLDLLHREVMGLSRLVDDLNTLARSDAGNLDYSPVPLWPLNQLGELIQTFLVPFERAGLEIDWTQAEDGGPQILGDPAHLRQIFSNLLQNTLRYTDSGGLLKITWTSESGRLWLYFDDTAPAVPADALPRLFERFFRVEVSRSRERGGTGIGLAVTRGLVEAHGGTVEAEASPLGGLRVALALPLIS